MQKIRQYFFIILLVIATALLGYNYVFRPFEDPIIVETVLEQTPQKDEKISPEDVLNSLSSQEKILQMIAVPIVVSPDFEQENNLINTATGEAESQPVVTPQKPGFFTLFGTGISFDAAQTTISNLKETNSVSGLLPLIAVDHEGGSVQRLSGEGFTKVSSWRTVCGLSTQERQEVLLQTARELKDVQVDVVLGPVLDVGNNPVLKDRICSIDSYAVVADRSMEYVTSFSDLGILPVLKHFPGIGTTKKDLHTTFDYVSVLQNDVKLYKYIIDQTEKIGVMTSHAGVVSQDRDVPCSLSQFCVGELKTAYPKVLIFTDALEMDSASHDKFNPRVEKSLIQVSKEAVVAGNDVLLYGQSVTIEELSQIVSELEDEYEKNPQFKSYVDKSVLKIIEYKYAAKQFIL